MGAIYGNGVCERRGPGSGYAIYLDSMAFDCVAESGNVVRGGFEVGNVI